MDISHDEYVQTPVPYERRGNGWSVFLIILGTQCGLLGIILSEEILRSMGIGMGGLAIVAGTLLTGALSSGTSYLGAKSGLSFAAITESVFGRRASMLVKLAIGLALVGWVASTSPITAVMSAGRPMRWPARSARFRSPGRWS